MVERIRWLDFLRFVAVMLVMARHVYDRTEQGHFLGETLASIGWMGVSLFFVISGYIVGGPMLERIRAGTFRYSDFIVSRAFRILPAALVILAVCHALKNYDDPVGAGSYLQALFFYNYAQPYIELPYTGQFWSLAVEQHFYLLAPLILALPIRLPAVVAFLLSFEAAKFFFGTYTQSHWQVDYFAAGILLYLARDRRFSLGGWPAALAMLAVACFIDPPRDGFGMLLALVASILIFVAAKQGPQSVVSERVFQALGRLSYAMYLVHLIVIEYPWTKSHLHQLSTHYDGAVRYLACFGYVFTLTLAGAIALHFLIERPFLLLRDSMRAKPPVARFT